MKFMNDLRLDVVRIVRRFRSHPEHGKPGCIERIINELITGAAIRLGMTAVVKLDRKERANGVSIAQQKIHMLGLHAVEVRLSRGCALGHVDEVSQAYLGEDGVFIAHDVLQHTEE